MSPFVVDKQVFRTIDVLNIMQNELALEHYTYVNGGNFNKRYLTRSSRSSNCALWSRSGNRADVFILPIRNLLYMFIASNYV